MKRSPVKRGRTPLRRRTRLRALGARGLAHRERMDRLRLVVMERAKGRCEAAVVGVCRGEAVHAHHVWPSGRGGPDVVENLIAVCAPCHDWIHNGDPELARIYGFLRSDLPSADDAA